MSLDKAAQYLASHGRGEDSMLVHMTPTEVKGLQSLAMANGGSLSVNPHTGLAEAGFLKNILPMVAGAALTAATGGAAAPWMIGLGYGAFETARTGDISKGLMAGLGAYGGAGLGGMAGLGASAAPGASTAGAGAGTGVSTAGGAGAGTSVTPTASGGLGAAQSSVGLNAGTSGATGITAPTNSLYTPNLAPAAPTNYAQMAKYGASAAAPVLADATTPKPPEASQEEEDPRYKGSPYQYRLSKNFQGYTPSRPNPYYRPAGLGYAAGGDVMLAAGGSYDDEPMGDIEQMAKGGKARAKYTTQAQLNAMDPWEASLAELDNSIYFSRGPGAVEKTPSKMTGLGDVQVGLATGGSLGGYSDGGRMLRGPGDGMSDSIPATISGKQPARLADGEFVVPADVVSHLGNGSTDAGAKKLYAMMDKVRTARTGKKKQAPAVKANKYLPV